MSDRMQYIEALNRGRATEKLLNKKLKKVTAERDKYRTAIEKCIGYANNRETEWGSRAEEAFEFLYNALKSQSQKKDKNADADCEACVHYKDTCDGEAFNTGCREFRTA